MDEFVGNVDPLPCHHIMVTAAVWKPISPRISGAGYPK